MLKRKHIYFLEGSSMYPSLRDGDLLLVSPERTPLPGDIVLFEAAAGDGNRCRTVVSGKKFYIAHRVIAVENDRFRTRGDNTVRSDGEIPRSAIVGVGTAVVRNRQVLSLSRRSRISLWLGVARTWVFAAMIHPLSAGVVKVPVYAAVLAVWLRRRRFSMRVTHRDCRDILRFYYDGYYAGTAKILRSDGTVILRYVRRWCRIPAVERVINDHIQTYLELKYQRR